MKHLQRLLPVLLVLPLAACGSSGDSEADKKKLTVFAAASLTATFEVLEEQYEDAHPDVDVKLSFAGSSDLVAQIAAGAQADVFASADANNMDKLVDAGLAAGDPVEFATNTLIIAVPPGNPAGVETLADLAEADLQLVVCAPEVPCGAAAVTVAETAGVELEPVSEEQSVTDVLAKVEAGEADAGLVYVTDVRGAGDSIEGIAFPEAATVVNHYPVVAVEGSDHADLAQAWVDLVLSASGQKVLSDAGFGPPA